MLPLPDRAPAVIRVASRFARPTRINITSPLENATPERSAPVGTGVCRNEAHFLPRFAGSTTRGAFAAIRPPQVAHEVRLGRVWQASDLLEHGYHVLNVAGPGPRHDPGQPLEPSNPQDVAGAHRGISTRWEGGGLLAPGVCVVAARGGSPT